MATMQAIKDHAVYKQMLAESFGGVMYNVANRNKYDTTELLELWNSLTPQERNSADGIMTGLFNFIQGK